MVEGFFNLFHTLPTHPKASSFAVNGVLRKTLSAQTCFRRVSFSLRGFVLKVSESSEICAVGGKKRMLPGDSCRVFGASKRCLKHSSKPEKFPLPKKRDGIRGSVRIMPEWALILP